MVAFGVPDGTVFAEEAEKRRELAQIRERLQSAQKSREELESRRESLDQELADTERNYGRLATAIRELEAEARYQTQRLGELQRRRENLLGAVKNQRGALAGQARAAYAAGNQEWLKLMLNQEDPSRLTRVLAYYSYLNRARSSLLQEMESELTAVRQLQDELWTESERLKGTRRRMAAEQAALDESKRVRRRLLADLRNELRGKDAELQRLREDEQRLQDLLMSIQLSGQNRSSTESASAANPLLFAPEASSRCPVAGRLVGQFGSPRMSGRWDGILIAAEEGTPVRAVSNGRVAFSDWLRGYGLLTIIDHGDGVMSLYAFNQSLYKNVGDPVAAGDIIAAVGSSGGRAEPGLYFGIREQGRAVDPISWCARTN
jgi:septal ring factor EnvC (AmiA/AmiB activator)